VTALNNPLVASSAISENRAEDLVASAQALRPVLVERQADTEERGFYSEETHQALSQAGFFKMLVPRRYGGLELTIPEFTRVIIEIAHGCPSTGWSVCLPSGHALMVAAWFSEAVQDDVFGSGEFRCPAVAAPYGTVARASDGSWLLDGVHSYCSGAPYGTHFLGQTFVDGDPESVILFLAPRSAWTVLDDWGDTIGLRGSGSHSIRFDHARISSAYALEGAWMIDIDVTGGSIGSRLHENPMYAGRAPSFFTIELGALAVGMLRGALDEYEQILRSRKTQRPPIVARYLDPEYQRWFGLAAGRAEAAEAMLLQCAEQYMQVCKRGIDTGVPFSREDDLRLCLIGNEVSRLCWETMNDYVYRTAGTGAARRGQRMERVFRDSAMAWGHFANVLADWTARDYGRERLGIEKDTGRSSP
jgi:3-hydroxy-9,10-secoandrosta-1,3,5(10)-triene-9,17-dione monooxygenase